MKKKMLLLIPFLLLTGCKDAEEAKDNEGKIPSEHNYTGGKPGQDITPAKDPLKGSLTISTINKQSMIAGENNQIESNRSVFNYDLNDIFNTPEILNPGIAKLGLLLSAQQYDFYDVNTYLVSLSSTTIDYKNEIMKKLNFSDITSYPIIQNEYEIDSNDVIAFRLSHLECEIEGEKNNLVIVSFAGTTTDAEWKSNLDLGSTVTSYMENSNEHPDWTNHKHHKGMDVAKNRAKRKIEAYVSEKIKNSYPTTYFVSGHSRGAGVANLYGKDLLDANKKAVVYTFNGANVVEKEDNMPQYNTIFNFENTHDILSAIPSTQSGFTKYGRTFKIDFVNADINNATFASEFINKINYEYKSLSDSNLDLVTQTLNEIMTDRDNLYSINANAYEDDFTIINNLSDEETAKAKVLNAAKKYGCDSKIVFNQPEATSNGKYKLSWRISNSMVLDIVGCFLSKTIELDMNNFLTLMTVMNELNTFTPTLTSKIYNIITFLMADTAKIAIPHSPDTFYIGTGHVA